MKREEKDQTRWHIVWLLFSDNALEHQDEKSKQGKMKFIMKETHRNECYFNSNVNGNDI